MFEKYSLCVISDCDAFIELRQGIWWDEDNNAVGFEFHKHIPYKDGEYKSHKFGDDIRAEILYCWDISGNSDESLGETENFGYYALFKEFKAILEIDNYGFVYVYAYDSSEAVKNAWDHKEQDYRDWLDENVCQCGSRNCDYYMTPNED